MAEGRPAASFRGDRRGASVTVSYVLHLTIATVLLGGLLVGASGTLDSQTERVARDQLGVVGEQLAHGLVEADQLARAGEADAAATGESPLVVVSRDLPDRVAGSSYTIVVRADELELRAADPDVVVRVPFRLHPETSVEPTSLPGGAVEVVYAGGSLEVRSA